MKVTAMAAKTPAIAALQENGVLLASSPAGTTTSRSIKVVSVMVDSFAQVLSLGEPRVALDSSQTFNNPAAIEFRCDVDRAPQYADSCTTPLPTPKEPGSPAAGSDE